MADAGDVRRVLAVASRLRSWDIEVREMPGFDVRGATWARVPVGVVDHHDASSVKSGEWGALGVIVGGRTGIPGPLSNFQGARCLDGRPKVALCAAGRANHAGVGGPYRFPDGVVVPADSGNSWLYGVEWANDGLGELYTPAAVYAKNGLYRALLEVCA